MWLTYYYTRYTTPRNTTPPPRGVEAVPGTRQVRRIRVCGPPTNKRRRTDGFSRDHARDTVFVFGPPHRCSAGRERASAGTGIRNTSASVVAGGERTVEGGGGGGLSGFSVV